MLFPERVQDMPTTAVVEAVTELREELRPPKYGAQLNKDTSRIFFTKYLEYKRRVERANVGGAEKYQLVPISQLVIGRVRTTMAWRFFNKGSMTEPQLEWSIEAKARSYEEDDEDSQECLPERAADAGLAEVPPRQQVAVDTPCMIEAVAACDPCPACTTSEPLVREADCPDGVMPSGGVAFGDGVDLSLIHI